MRWSADQRKLNTPFPLLEMRYLTFFNTLVTKYGTGTVSPARYRQYSVWQYDRKYSTWLPGVLLEHLRNYFYYSGWPVTAAVQMGRTDTSVNIVLLSTVALRYVLKCWIFSFWKLKASLVAWSPSWRPRDKSKFNIVQKKRIFFQL